MTQLIDRRFLLRAAMVGGLGACLADVRACEFFCSTLRVTHPWTRASAPGASTAIISMKFDEVREDERLIGLETPVAARAEIGGAGAGRELNFLIPAGQDTQLSEAGTFIRLIGLKHPLESGRSYPLTLIFEKGGRIEADLSVDFDS
ncbi:copper chaperone PCu(A)C [Roseateles oligotrophus]|uniref:Copper chaperone PCu(A)C n=1 Tax=Roseateles oligotrophus TaxID=1769250 RepID=A0ABT2YJZ0_9BURK|nr:copper chaperone PCu(A)C [Roseateles oligotrophus]MCV2370363.1 copper chaperone PCu(A)C [Roseateles oligotrophus]